MFFYFKAYNNEICLKLKKNYSCTFRPNCILSYGKSSPDPQTYPTIYLSSMKTGKRHQRNFFPLTSIDNMINRKKAILNDAEVLNMTPESPTLSFQ